MLLLVDDDELFRSGLAANLRDDGYEVIEYSSGESVPFDRLADIEVVLTDYMMGKEDGLAFAQRFHTAFPKVPVILITAFATAHLDAAAARLSYLTLMNKPVDYEALLQRLQQLIHR